MGGYLPKQGKHLKTLREKNGLTQIDVANKIGCTVKTYRSWEKGVTAPDTIFLIQLSQIYNVSTDFILGMIEEKNRDNKFICEFTGLSEKAIELIKADSAPPFSLFMRTLNALLSSEEFYNGFCSAVCGVLASIYDINSFLKTFHGLSALTVDELMQLEKESKRKLKDIKLSLYEVSRNCNYLIDSIYPTKSTIEAINAKIDEINEMIDKMIDKMIREEE